MGSVDVRIAGKHPDWLSAVFPRCQACRRKPRDTSLFFSSRIRFMSELKPHQFAQRISDLGLAERREVDQAMSELGVGDHTLDEMIKVMQRRGLVTTLQTDKILKGDRIGYFYGDYKVLYVIGAGTFAGSIGRRRMARSSRSRCFANGFATKSKNWNNSFAKAGWD